MKKIKRSNILMLGIVIYIVFQIGTVFMGKAIKTLALEPEELEVKITTKGLIIREEYIINANETGNIEMLYEPGQKVKKQENISNIYINNVDDINSQINNLDEEIDSLQLDLKNNQSNLSKDIKQKQLKNKVEQRKILQNKKEKSISTVHSSISGIISYKSDGKEERYTLDNMKNITKEDINKESNRYKEIYRNDNIKKGEPIARVINNSNIYIAICVNANEASKFKVNQKLKIGIENEKIDAQVYEIYINKSEFVIILKTMNQNVGIYDTRVKEFDIIYKQMEGLKIPKSSVEVIDEKSGVYVVNQQTRDLDFVEIKGIEYENEEFIFVDYYKNGITATDTVSLYDEIILDPNGINKHMKIR